MLSKEYVPPRPVQTLGLLIMSTKLALEFEKYLRLVPGLTYPACSS